MAEAAAWCYSGGRREELLRPLVFEFDEFITSSGLAGTPTRRPARARGAPSPRADRRRRFQERDQEGAVLGLLERICMETDITVCSQLVEHMFEKSTIHERL